MKYLKHRVYGLLFSLFKHTHIYDNRISFIIDSGESFKGNLDYIKKEFEKRGDFEFYFFTKTNFPFLTLNYWPVLIIFFK